MTHYSTLLQTYLRWANSLLCERGVIVSDIGQLEDGRILAILIDVLNGGLVESNEADDEREADLYRVEAVLDNLHNHGIQLRLSPHDVLNGDMKTILDLLWALIVHFTLNSIDTPSSQRTLRHGKILIMEWCTDYLTETKYKLVHSITENFTGNDNLAALIEMCCSISRPEDIKNCSSVTRLATALIAAEETLGIVKTILSPGDVINGTADECSLLIFLALLKRKVFLLTSCINDDSLTEPVLYAPMDGLSAEADGAQSAATTRMDGRALPRTYRQCEGALSIDDTRHRIKRSASGGNEKKVKQESHLDQSDGSPEHVNQDELLKLLDTIGVLGQEMRESLNSTHGESDSPFSGHEENVITRLVEEIKMLRTENRGLFQELARSRSFPAGDVRGTLKTCSQKGGIKIEGVHPSQTERHECSGLPTVSHVGDDGGCLCQSQRFQPGGRQESKINSSGSIKENHVSLSLNDLKEESLLKICGASAADARSDRPLKDLVNITMEENELLRVRLYDMMNGTHSRPDQTEDELERLKKDNADLRAKCQELEKVVESVTEHSDIAHRRLDRFQQHIEILQAQNAKLMQHIRDKLGRDPSGPSFVGGGVARDGNGAGFSGGSTAAKRELGGEAHETPGEGNPNKTTNDIGNFSKVHCVRMQHGRGSGDASDTKVNTSSDQTNSLHVAIMVNGRGEAEGSSNRATPGLPEVTSHTPWPLDHSESEADQQSDSDYITEESGFPDHPVIPHSSLPEQRLRFNLQRGIRSPSLGSLIQACATEGAAGKRDSVRSSDCGSGTDSVRKQMNTYPPDTFYTPQCKKTVRHTVTHSESKVRTGRRSLHLGSSASESTLLERTGGTHSASQFSRVGRGGSLSSSAGVGPGGISKWRQLRYSKARTLASPSRQGIGSLSNSSTDLQPDSVLGDCPSRGASEARLHQTSSSMLSMSTSHNNQRDYQSQSFSGGVRLVKSMADTHIKPSSELSRRQIGEKVLPPDGHCVTSAASLQDDGRSSPLDVVEFQQLPDQISDHRRVSPPRTGQPQHSRPTSRSSVARVSLPFNAVDHLGSHLDNRATLDLEPHRENGERTPHRVRETESVRRTTSTTESGISSCGSESTGYIHRMLSPADQSCANSIISKYLQAEKKL